MTPEPAVRGYFFGKGYRDLRATIASSWSRNKEAAEDFFAKASGGSDGVELIEFGLWTAAGISTYVFGTVSFVVASLVHALVLLLCTLLIYLGFTVLWLGERCVFAVRSFFMACPHCHERTMLPHYLCDGCARVHTKLLPNAYGVFFHLCLCGTKLPASVFLNRGRLQARCPYCGQNIAREHGESRRLFIAVMGGPSVGKSSFMFDAVRQFMEREAAALGLEADFTDTRSADAFRRVVGMTRLGRVPEKSVDFMPRAFHLSLRKNGKLAWFLYLYDPAGEAFEDEEKLRAHAFHKYLSGMILIVDPFATVGLQRHYASELEAQRDALKPSAARLEDVLDRLLFTLESQFDVGRDGRVRRPLAVVVNKVDAFGLEGVIGGSVLERRVGTGVEGRRVDWGEEEYSEVLKKALCDWGERGFVERVEGRLRVPAMTDS